MPSTKTSLLVLLIRLAAISMKDCGFRLKSWSRPESIKILAQATPRELGPLLQVGQNVGQNHDALFNGSRAGSRRAGCHYAAFVDADIRFLYHYAGLG